MNSTTIEKCLKLLEQQDYIAARELLETERVKAIFAEKGTNTTFTKAVKNYITATRTDLAGVGIDNEKPFLCDGYSLIAWKREQPQLAGLPQPEKKLNPDALLANQKGVRRVGVTDDERKIASNLDKYIKLYPTKKHDYCPVYLFGAFWDAKYLLPLFNITGFDFTEACIKETEVGRVYSAVLENDDLKLLILPLRVDDEKVREQTKTRQAEFCAEVTK